MRTRINRFRILLCAAIVPFVHGCVTKRTVTEDGVVVAQGYVVKGPLRGIGGY